MAKEPKRIGYELLTDELKALVGGSTGEATVADWTTITNKPLTFSPSAHTHVEFHSHVNKAILDSITQEKITQWEGIATHAHNDVYYTEEEVDTLLTDKSNIGHTHTGISPAEHTHVESEIVDLDKYTKAETNALLLNKSGTTHSHDGAYYKKTEVDSKLSNKSEKIHSHTKANITDFAHVHSVNDVTDLAIPTDTNQLSKTDVYTKDEVDGLMISASLGDMTKAVYDSNGDGVVNRADSADEVDWGGVQNKPLSFVPTEHEHVELHTHSNMSVLNMVEEAFTAGMKDKLTSLQNYIHPSGDGNLHVPSNGTTNAGKVLKSTSVAGNIGWGSISPADIGAAPSTHMHTVAQITNFPSFSRLTLGTTQPTDGYWFKEV